LVNLNINQEDQSSPAKQATGHFQRIDHFLSLTPAPPPFSGINSTPGASSGHLCGLMIMIFIERRGLLLAKIWMFLLLCAALGGCQADGKAKTVSWLQTQGMDEGAATLLASNKPALRQYLMNKSMASQDDAYCQSLGARVGSDAYVQCRTSVSANRPVNDPPPRPKPITCTSNVILGALRTTCQ
ncbi:hypothetical protein, partial [Mesorhizobium sp.]